MVKRTQKRTSPVKIRKLVEGKDSLETKFAELSVLVPDAQTALDSDSVPWSVKREKVDTLSSLLDKILVFSPPLIRTMQQDTVGQQFSSEV